MIDRLGLDLDSEISANKRPCAFFQVFGVLYKFYRHPYLFRMKSVSNWADEWHDFGYPEKRMRDVNPRFIDLVRIYQPILDSVVAQKQKEAMRNVGTNT